MSKSPNINVQREDQSYYEKGKFVGSTRDVYVTIGEFNLHLAFDGDGPTWDDFTLLDVYLSVTPPDNEEIQLWDGENFQQEAMHFPKLTTLAEKPDDVRVNEDINDPTTLQDLVEQGKATDITAELQATQRQMDAEDHGRKRP